MIAVATTALAALAVVAQLLARRPWSAIGTALVAAPVLVALTEPRLPGDLQEPLTVDIVDVSSSVSADPDTAAPLRVRVGRTATADPKAPVDPRATHLAQGLRLAGSLVAPGRAATLRVHTDGQLTEEEAAKLPAVLQTLAARGISVEPVPPEAAPTDLPPAPAHLALAAAVVAAGESVPGTLRWHPIAPTAQLPELTATLATESSEPVEIQALPQPDNTLLFAIPADTPAGAAALTLALADSPQRSATAALTITRPPRVRLLRGSARDGAELERLLQAEGFAVTPTAPTAPLTPEALADTDLVVLANTPTTGPGALHPTTPAALDRFVQDGGGLLTLGGDRAYSAGGWHESPLASLLPVKLEPDGAEKDDSVALLIILDKSGSMARPAADAKTAPGMVSGVADMMTGGKRAGSKIRVASEAAAATIDKLRDFDRVGVLAVDTRPYWALPLTAASERATAKKRARSISAAGGGMYVLTALQAAAPAMKAETAPLRHIVMLVDASDAGEQTQDVFGDTRSALSVAADLKASGVTVSIVGLGSEKSRDSGYLTTLARTGGGRLKLTPDIRTVSSLFAQEVERLTGDSIQEPTPAPLRQKRWHPALRGVDIAQAPPIWGWAEADTRPRARTVLTTKEGAPVLATWSRGLGEVAAWTTDDGARWARGWPRWSGSPPFFTQLARSLGRDPGGRSERIRVYADSDGLMRVQVRSLSADTKDADRLPTGDLTVTAGGAPVQTKLVAPGVVEALLPGKEGTFTTVTVTRGTEPYAELTAAIPSPVESAHSGLSDAILDALRQPAPAPDSPPSDGRALWPWLLALSAVLVPVAAWLRRRDVPA